MITSLFDLDRTVQKASGALAQARRALRARSDWDEPPDNPLAPFRSVLGKDTVREVEGVPDPLLGPALRSHLSKLVLARVLWDDEVRVARAWSSASVEFDQPLPKLPSEALPKGASHLSPRSLLAAILIDPEDDRRRRTAEAFVRAVHDHVRDPTLRFAERRAAAALKLGVPLEEIDLPAPMAALQASATDLLAGTASIAERFAPWDRGLFAMMAHSASRGWPAHLSPRWVLSIFAGTQLGRGVSIDQVPLPSVLGATSFARALAVFGEAFGHAAGPSSAPFTIARPVVDLRPLRIGAIFGMLLGERVVARRVLDLGASAAHDHVRAFARAFSAQVRLAAAALGALPSFFPPKDDLADRFCETTSRAWGEPLPSALVGVLPRLTPSTACRFAAMLLAASDRARLIERFDEDFYRNPRGVEALHALACEPQPPVTEELLRDGATALIAHLSASAG